jgi:hypothetical protein
MFNVGHFFIIIEDTWNNDKILTIRTLDKLEKVRILVIVGIEGKKMNL